MYSQTNKFCVLILCIVISMTTGMLERSTQKLVFHSQAPFSIGETSEVNELMLNGFGFSKSFSELGDLFKRPRANILVVVPANKESGEMEEYYKETSHEGLSEVQGELLLDNFVQQYHHVFPNSNVVVASSNKNLIQSVADEKIDIASDLKSLNKQGLQLISDHNVKSDFDLFNNILSLASSTDVTTDVPDLFVFIVEQETNVENVGQRISQLVEVSQNVYGRVAFEVLTLPYEATEARKLQATDTYNGADLAMMIWTSVIMVLIMFSVFCCVPWTDELDPILKVGIKTDSFRSE